MRKRVRDGCGGAAEAAVLELYVHKSGSMTGMSNGDDGSVYRSAMPERIKRRRRRIVVGAVGLAAVLGAGAFVVTDQLTGSDDRREPAAIAPVTPTADATTPTSPAATSGSPPAPVKSTRSAARQRTSPSPSPSPSVPQATGLSVAEAPVAERNVRTADGIVRVVSAKSDLTGHRDLRMVGDEGIPVGEARCTQHLKVNNDTKVHVVPTMLLCWRTSEARSVVTVAISNKGRPSTSRSVTLLDSEWAKLG